MDIVARLVKETEDGLKGWLILPEEETCTEQEGFARVTATVPLTEKLFKQLMNGATGYRAHFSVSTDDGEWFNRQIIDSVAPIIASAKLHPNGVTRPFCEKSLLGPFSKIWYPKSLTDPNGQRQFDNLPEEILVARWVDYWRTQPPPRKGLLAPVPPDCSILLIGTFINDTGESFEQKAGRSDQLFWTGWT